MALFAILHLWAFPYAPYTPGAPRTFYPVPDADKASPSVENERHAPTGGFVGLSAICDALNVWDFIKAFGRGMRWLFCGVKRRKEDISYRLDRSENLDMDDLANLANPKALEARSSYDRLRPQAATSQSRHNQSPPTMQEYGHSGQQPPSYHPTGRHGHEERAVLMDNAQPNPEAHANSQPPPRPLRDPSLYEAPYQVSHQQHIDPREVGVAHGHYEPYNQPDLRQPAPTDAQAIMGQAMWGREPRQS